MSERLKYEDLELQNYINSREVFAGLTVADLASKVIELTDKVYRGARWENSIQP